MSEAVLAALITGVLSLVGVIIANMAASTKMQTQMKITQAVTDTKLDNLTQTTKSEINNLTMEVREHNNFARRIPVIEEQMKVANHRIDDLERAQNK